MIFSEAFPDPLTALGVKGPRSRDTTGGSLVRRVFGTFEIDLAPLAAIGSDLSNSTFGPVSTGFHREATAFVFDSDSVAIALVPRMSHGGLSLAGRLLGDTLTGEWVQRRMFGGAHGQPPPPHAGAGWGGG